jgi:hypothetical protein
MKPNKENIITDILIELEIGITYTDCLALFDLNWSIPTTTFKRYWKEANLRYKEVNLKAQKVFEDTILQSAKDRLKSNIMAKEERMLILSQIARGEIPMTKHIVCDSVIQEREVAPNWIDRKAAIAELNKMDGDYAPIKSETKITNVEIDFTD